MSEQRTPLDVRVAASAASRRKYPEKSRARNKVQRAVKSGRLVRPDRCARCGVACRPEASHDDYARPLDVEWLCRPCHAVKDRPTSCPAGHALDEANTYLVGNNQKCRACHRKASRKNYRATAFVVCPLCNKKIAPGTLPKHSRRHHNEGSHHD